MFVFLLTLLVLPIQSFSEIPTFRSIVVMTQAQTANPALSKMASEVLKLQLVNPVSRLEGVRTLMQQHRKSGQIVFFN